ncbi:hypothetical protein [Candidatus Tisiphia endosymbiont of Thecophora atra]|uniref:hypothetical protein n=1 Tax=Candidatus Tisiphia endosymbiont of Thecophora atra TaxID=3066258 RepID=UPI00312CA2F5
MVLFNKLQNNFLIKISNRYLVTRCIIVLFLFILFFLLQGFGTSNVLAAGVNNEQINLPHLDPTTNREYFENEIEATRQLIDEARGELKTLEQEYNSHRVTKALGKKNNYYSEAVDLLEKESLKSLELMKEYTFEQEKILDEISYNETLQSIKKKGLILINQLIKRNDEEYYEEYYKAQSEAKLTALVEKDELLLKIKEELEKTLPQDAVYLDNLQNENNKQGGSEYNVVNTDPEIYEDNFSDHSTIVEILKKIDISPHPQDLKYDDNKKETLDTELNKVNKKLGDLAQKIREIEQQSQYSTKKKIITTDYQVLLI